MIRVMLLSALLAPAALAAQDTVRFTPTVQQPTFAVREPVLRIHPGTVLVSRTHFGPYYTEAGGAFPGEVGPIYIEGATTKDLPAWPPPRSTPTSAGSPATRGCGC